ncbi:MAG: SPOR domain-containing protein [Oligoflexia bacterium]|nr:SPOR domain-containing protein [Oligoflexia bacterium]
MLNQNGGSRTDTLIKLVLVFFLSLLSFSVGTFVGKQFSDSQHKLADLEGDATGDERSTASIPEDVAKIEPQKAISDEEINNLANEFEEKSAEQLHGKAVGENKEVEAEHKHAAQQAPKKSQPAVKDEIAQISKKVAAGETVDAPVEKPSKVPTQLPRELASSSLGAYTIQIASFPNEEEAKKKVQQLIEEKSLPAIVVPTNVKGKPWFRVGVGKYPTAKQAQDDKASIQKKAGVDSSIIQRIGQ